MNIIKMILRILSVIRMAVFRIKLYRNIMTLNKDKISNLNKTLKYF